MAYENTHLFAANIIKNKIENETIRNVIEMNQDAYHIGSIFPDIFDFTRDTTIKTLSAVMHKGTNEIVFQVLDRLRGKKDEENLAFVFGYLTHCAVDQILHPVVFYFSGYTPQMNDVKKKESIYQHFHIETLIDNEFNDRYFLEDLIKPEVGSRLDVDQILGISIKRVPTLLKNQKSFFKRNRSYFYYLVYKAMDALGINHFAHIGAFYPNLKKDKRRLPEILRYRDIITGEEKETTWKKLMEEAFEMAIKKIKAAYDYYIGKISRHECEAMIPQYNLQTGKIGITIADIKFSLHS